MTNTLVIGLGSPDRGDDAVGSLVARAVAGLRLADVRVVAHEDPTALIDLWAATDLTVVVDAVVSGCRPGALHVLDVGAESQQPPDTDHARQLEAHARRLSASGRRAPRRGGTHAFGLGASVELARALHRLPPRLVLVGVEAASFEHGAPLSDAVSAAVPEAVRRVVEVIEVPPAASPSPRGANPAPRHTQEAGHVPR